MFVLAIDASGPTSAERCLKVFLLCLQQHTDKLNTQVALHQLYQYASKYYDVVNSCCSSPELV